MIKLIKNEDPLCDSQIALIKPGTRVKLETGYNMKGFLAETVTIEITRISGEEFFGTFIERNDHTSQNPNRFKSPFNSDLVNFTRDYIFALANN